MDKVNEKRLRSTADAVVWAEEFKKVCPDVDGGLMIGWFANLAETVRHEARDEMGEHQVKYRPQDIKTKTFVFYVNVYNKENIRKFDSREEADEVADNWSGRLGEAERIEIRRNVE